MSKIFFFLIILIMDALLHYLIYYVFEFSSYWELVALCWVVVMYTVYGSRFLYVSCGACGVREILGFLRMWRYRLWLFVEMCWIRYIFGCRRIVWVVCRTLIFYFLVRFSPLFRGSFVYFMCTRVAPLCAF